MFENLVLKLLSLGDAVTILIAGYETTATALTFTLYLLAKHPEIQEELRQELRSIYDPSLDACQFDDNRCELLDRVWYESMRMYPPVVAFVTRTLDHSIPKLQLESGITIDQGTSVYVPVWTVHHDARNWPDPDTFNPHRDGLPIPGHAATGKSACKFLAFGGGPRNCIGGNLALTEGRAVLAHLLLKYSRIELAVQDDSLIDPGTGFLKLYCPTVIIHPQENILLNFIE